jgi:hypothetical protein
MNKEAKIIFNGILAKLGRGEALVEYEQSFLRARRSYLSSWQKLRYGDILYLNRQFLFYKIKTNGVFLLRFSKEIIIALIVYIVVSFFTQK